MENRTWLGKRGLKSLKDRLQAYLGERPELVGEEIITQNPLSAAQIDAIWDRINGLDVLDSYDTSKLRNLTVAQIQTAVNNVVSLADAKVILFKMTMAIKWLVDREGGIANLLIMDVKAPLATTMTANPKTKEELLEERIAALEAKLAIYKPKTKPKESFWKRLAHRLS